MRKIRTIPIEKITLGEIDRLLRGELIKGGLASLTYFGTPNNNGYAAVTRLEQIDKSGRHLKGDKRFTKELSDSSNILMSFFSQLVSVPEGRFRLIAFFVTTDDVATQYTDRIVTLMDADRWVNYGCDILPRRLTSQHIDRTYMILARVYEFMKRGERSTLVAKTESHSVGEHLSDIKFDIGE